MVKQIIAVAAALIVIAILLWNSIEVEPVAPELVTPPKPEKMQLQPLSKAISSASTTNSDINTDNHKDLLPTEDKPEISVDILAKFERLQQISDEEVLRFFIELAAEGKDTTALVFRLIEEGILTVNVPLDEGPGIDTPLIIAMALDPEITPAEIQQFIDLGSYQTFEYSFLSVTRLKDLDSAELISTHLGYGPEHGRLLALGSALNGNKGLFDRVVDGAPSLLTSSELQMQIESSLKNMGETAQLIEGIKKRHYANGDINESWLKKRVSAVATEQIERRQMLLEMQTLSFEQRSRLKSEIKAFEDEFGESD
ncbi:hypothetical protein [Salinimonas iocasae]|uniref:Uncharacterized protein n=1 Tax=Salinimonas iocasae TaxID=2572577 RepID=A0A5B7YFV9_9ALTE|nr:hypothetical protein [Salinimonas iocasae]QCZ94632.1 hypothetical protein FBQ74_14660 [Salinimonas iocasae]